MKAQSTSKPSRAKIQKTLHDVFGLDQFRDAQAEVIDSVLKGRPTLAVMPTGAGKSLCYQLPTHLGKGTTLVVSPLIALMRDQRQKMDGLQIDAVELNSSLSQKEQDVVLKKLCSKSSTEVLYVTPERLSDPDFLKTLMKIDIGLFVIDEVHCLSQWGHDFRPAYLDVAKAWAALGQPRLLGLTATATDEVIDDLKSLFKLPSLNVICSGVFRENLSYSVVHVDDEEQKIDALIDLIRQSEGSGIIYSASVRGVEEITHLLNSAGFDAVSYHGRMPTKERHENQEAFMTGVAPIIVATNAFGMGIDKADIRFVIHYHFDGSLESYYQESGRAGRDGQTANCTLLYLKRDKSMQSFFLAGKYPSLDEVTAVYRVVLAQKRIGLKKLQEALPKVAKSKVRVIVSAMQNASIMDAETKAGFSVVKKDLNDVQLGVVFKTYQDKKVRDQEKLKAMIVYAQSALCRWKSILNYFGQEAAWSQCGHCDNCLKHAGVDLQTELLTPLPPAPLDLAASAMA